MKLDVNNTAFGRHETFAVRYGWLTKGYQAVRDASKGKQAFLPDESTITLGVGKNMVQSIRYWMSACQILDAVTLRPTALGEFIFDKKKGADPYLEDEATLWVLHWALATNADLATAWYWFFNKFHKTEFTSTELSTALADWVKSNIKTKVATSTIKADASLILRMYTQSTGNTRTPIEEALDSPLSLLKLTSQTAGGRSFQTKPAARPGLPVAVIGYAVADLFEKRGVTSLPMEELMYSRDDFPALGSVFRLTEADLTAKLENMIAFLPGKFEIRETAGIHQLYLLSAASSLDYLRNYYFPMERGKAA